VAAWRVRCSSGGCMPPCRWVDGSELCRSCRECMQWGTSQATSVLELGRKIDRRDKDRKTNSASARAERSIRPARFPTCGPHWCARGAGAFRAADGARRSPFSLFPCVDPTEINAPHIHSSSCLTFLLASNSLSLSSHNLHR
jgi:hypothetical protein